MIGHEPATDDDLDLAPPQRTRFLVAALVVMIHVALVLGLIKAFAPDFAAHVTESVLATFNVTITAPPPPPPPKQPEQAGAAAEAGRKAVPREVSLPKPKLAIARPSAAPPVAAHGADNSSGARDAGSGSGAGGQGNGTGSGSGGSGQGGGAASRVAKIAGDINATRDFPAASREVRLGHEVIVVMTVGTDGRARNCRVQKSSPDPQADAIVCRLAEQRFRFKPAIDANGNPVESTYGWRQRWFQPGTAN